MSDVVDISSLRDSFPEYAKDIKINLGSVLTSEGAPDLSEVQIYAVALACCYSLNNKRLTNALESTIKAILSEEYIRAAKGVSALMAMNNVYYRFTHLIHDDDISKLPARLRMSFMAQPGIEKIDFELMSLAVSAINGCGMCMESHTKQLLEKGITRLGIQSAIRIAATLNAASSVINNS